jgi:hypothetical protein
LEPGTTQRPAWNGKSPLKIGAFGAIRALKNIMSAAAAAMTIADKLKVDVMLSVSGGRAEGGGLTVLAAVEAMLAGLPAIQLNIVNWTTWPEFTTIVRNQDLLLNVSYTESFNMVTADGIAGGVPSVVSDAIDWAPPAWVASADDVLDIADTGILILHDHYAPAKGLAALRAHNATGLVAWKQFLTS